MHVKNYQQGLKCIVTSTFIGQLLLSEVGGGGNFGQSPKFPRFKKNVTP